MGRRRAQRPVAGVGDGASDQRRTPPVGPARLAWSYVAALLAGVIVGLAFALADAVQQGYCADTDETCALGVFTLGGVAGGVLGVSLAAWLVRLGWEWWLLCVAAIVALPALLDLTGPPAWLMLAVTPGIAAGLTWLGPTRPRWRPVALGAFGIAVIAWALVTTFWAPGS